MARRGSPPVARARAPQRSTTAAPPASVQSANAQRKLSAPVPSTPGSAIAGAASGGYSNAMSRYGSAAVQQRLGEAAVDEQVVHALVGPGRDPERQRPSGDEQGERGEGVPPRYGRAHAKAGSRSTVASAAGSRGARPWAANRVTNTKGTNQTM